MWSVSANFETFIVRSSSFSLLFFSSVVYFSASQRTTLIANNLLADTETLCGWIFIFLIGIYGVDHFRWFNSKLLLNQTNRIQSASANNTKKNSFGRHLSYFTSCVCFLTDPRNLSMYVRCVCVCWCTSSTFHATYIVCIDSAHEHIQSPSGHACAHPTNEF